MGPFGNGLYFNDRIVGISGGFHIHPFEYIGPAVVFQSKAVSKELGDGLDEKLDACITLLNDPPVGGGHADPEMISIHRP